jgi:hypothetical protein
MEFLILALVAGLFGGFWYLSHLWEKKRRNRVVALSQELGLELNWQLPDDDRRVFSAFPLASKGRQPNAGLTLVADNGTTRIALFDYSFVTGHGKNKRTHHWTVALGRDTRLTGPEFSLEPETWISRVGSLVGYQDIDIAEDPEFSRAFVVRGASPDTIVAFLNGPRRALLLKNPKQQVSQTPGAMIVVRPRQKLDEKHVRPLLAESLALVQALITPEAAPR